LPRQTLQNFSEVVTMSSELMDTLKRTRPIWVARAILFYLLWVSIKHQQKDYGGYGIDSWLYAFAMEVSVSVGLSAILTILTTSHRRERFLILLFLPVLWLGMEQSVKASQRVFLADKTQQFNDEGMSLEAKMARNNLITAGNALQHLRDLSVTSGAQYSNARADYERAKSEWDAVKNNKTESSSAKALAATTESGDADQAALEVATKRAWLLMGFVLLFSAVSGLWTLITSPIEWESFTRRPAAKKPQGSSRPSAKKAVELLDLSGHDTAPTAAQPSKQAVSGRAGGRGQAKPGSSAQAQSGFSESASRAAAKEVAGQIKAGGFIRKNGQQAVDVLSTRDLVSHSASKKTQAAIMTHLEHMGVVEKQAGKKPALITKAYRPNQPDSDVISGLVNLGFKESDAKR
jgi:hypothetical protein